MKKDRPGRDQTLRAVIAVLDSTAAPFHAINEHFAATSAPLRQIDDRLGALAEETGLRRQRRPRGAPRLQRALVIRGCGARLAPRARPR